MDSPCPISHLLPTSNSLSSYPSRHPLFEPSSSFVLPIPQPSFPSPRQPSSSLHRPPAPRPQHRALKPLSASSTARRPQRPASPVASRAIARASSSTCCPLRLASQAAPLTSARARATLQGLGLLLRALHRPPSLFGTGSARLRRSTTARARATLLLRPRPLLRLAFLLGSSAAPAQLLLQLGSAPVRLRCLRPCCSSSGYATSPASLPAARACPQLPTLSISHPNAGVPLSLQYSGH